MGFISCGRSATLSWIPTAFQQTLEKCQRTRPACVICSHAHYYRNTTGNRCSIEGTARLLFNCNIIFLMWQTSARKLLQNLLDQGDVITVFFFLFLTLTITCCQWQKNNKLICICVSPQDLFSSLSPLIETITRQSLWCTSDFAVWLVKGFICWRHTPHPSSDLADQRGDVGKMD